MKLKNIHRRKLIALTRLRGELGGQAVAVILPDYVERIKSDVAARAALMGVE